MAAGRLKIDIRRQAILEKLNKDGQVFVTELSTQLGATAVTIRNDLDALAAEGRLERIQGGAIRRQQAAGQGLALSVSAPLQGQREAIAKAVLEYIHDGDTIFFNSGMTTATVAEIISQRSRLNVVTNSLAVANYLAHQPDTNLILLGGELNPNYGFTYGGNALEQLQQYQPQWSILSVDGVHPQRGITTYHANEVMIDRAMIAQAQKTLIVADHRKIGNIGFSHICNLDQCHALITDSSADQATLERIRQQGIEVRIATPVNE